MQPLMKRFFLLIVGARQNVRPLSVKGILLGLETANFVAQFVALETGNEGKAGFRWGSVLHATY
jgi:hypothetical protein